MRSRNFILSKIFLLGLIVFITLGLFVTNAYAFTSSPHRLSGADRYATAAAIAQDGWTQSDYAVLAYGENYPDALSAAPLAKKYDAPILLTGSNSLQDATKQTLIILQVKNAFIIGGTGIITSAVEDELKAMNITPTRIAGSDRYDTAVQVANQLVSPSEVFVTTGEDYPDALSIAPIAAIKQEPVILVPKDYMPDSVKAYVASHNITKTYIIGDIDIIDDRVVNQFPNAERIKGVDRYVRNINANMKFSNLFASKDISVASGEGFADALTGTAYAAKKGIPIVLVNSYPPAITRLYTVINLNMANSVNGTPYVFGGTGVVSDKAVSYLYTLASSDQPSQSNKSFAPTNLVATAISSSEITLQWDPVNDVDYYHVYVSFDGNEFISLQNDDGSNVQYKWIPGYSYKLYGIPANSTRYFKVTAVKGGIESEMSSVVSVTTKKDSGIHGPLKLIADDSKHTYLGKLTTNKFDTESIFNEFGTYGSVFSLKSIFNEFGTYGGEFSLYSPFNKFTITPPLIVDVDGNIVGRLTVNTAVIGAVSPYSIYDLLVKLNL